MLSFLTHVSVLRELFLKVKLFNLQLLKTKPIVKDNFIITNKHLKQTIFLTV